MTAKCTRTVGGEDSGSAVPLEKNLNSEKFSGIIFLPFSQNLFQLEQLYFCKIKPLNQSSVEPVTLVEKCSFMKQSKPKGHHLIFSSCLFMYEVSFAAAGKRRYDQTWPGQITQHPHFNN